MSNPPDGMSEAERQELLEKIPPLYKAFTDVGAAILKSELSVEGLILKLSFLDFLKRFHDFEKNRIESIGDPEVQVEAIKAAIQQSDKMFRAFKKITGTPEEIVPSDWIKQFIEDIS